MSDLAGVHIYSLAQMPVEGVLSASQPSSRGGDILIDRTLPAAERRVTLLHELKHLIDGEQTSGEELCTDFALSLLMPSAWLREDWQAGRRDTRELAERYQVPADVVRHRLYLLGLCRHGAVARRRIYCQWRRATKPTSSRHKRVRYITE